MRQSNRVRMDAGGDENGHALMTGEKLLHGQYTIQCYLSSGGFGVTYLARDSLDRRIVIKECFPALTCHRRGKIVMGRTKDDQEIFKTIVRNLMHEARRMARLSHPNIVGVHQVFEENGTAYLALDFVNGLDLLEIIERDPTRLTPKTVDGLLRKVLSAVEYMHAQDMLHRDISPDNILITQDNEPVLIDFGAAREVTNRASKALSTIDAVKEGYSPLEFYSRGADQTSSSDIYSIGASFYHVLTGNPPPDSLSRLSAVAGDEPDPLVPIPSQIEGYDRYFLAAIDDAMTLFPKDRMQSATKWLDQIDEERRQKALMDTAQEDLGMENLIRDLTNKTNKDMNAALEKRKAEEERQKYKAELQARAEAETKKQQVVFDLYDYDDDDDLAEVETETDPDADVPAQKQSRNRSFLGTLISLPSTLFSSKNSSLEAEQ